MKKARSHCTGSWVLFFLFSAWGALQPAPALAQSCPSGTAAATFDWSPSAGTGNEWLSSNNTNGASQVYTVSYTDAYGNPATVDVTVTLQDANSRNFDSNFVCPAIMNSNCDTVFPLFTETNGAFGSGFLTIGMASVSSSETVGFDFSFSKPVLMDDFSVGDMDDVGFGASSPEPDESYQDQLTFTASNGGANVPVTLVAGSNMTISGQTATTIVVPGTSNNLGPGDAAGTVTASTSQVFDTFSLVYQNGPDDATNEGGTGVSNGHAIRVSGFALCVEDIQPDLSIVKTANPPGLVMPGETITYTIDVTNDGPGAANNVTVTDDLPNGVTYTAGTAQKTYWVSGVQAGSLTQPLGGGTFDTGGLTQSFNTTGVIPAGATLTSFGFTTTGQSFDWLSDISLVANYPSGTAYNLPTGSFGGNGPGPWNVTQGPGAFGGPAEGVYQFIWDDSVNGVGGDDNSITNTTFTINYEFGAGRIQTTDAANAPANMVTAADGISLLPGETMTVTFDVTVDDPLPPGVTDIVNEAEAEATGIPPITDMAVTTTPVTLAYFEARGQGSVSFRWMTSTEVGNLGFNVYEVGESDLLQLNDELIPSHVVDSLEPQVYEFEATGVRGDTFVLEDVDIQGTVRHHGPFYADTARGSEVTETREVAWEEIRARRAERRAARAANARDESSLSVSTKFLAEPDDAAVDRPEQGLDLASGKARLRRDRARRDGRRGGRSQRVAQFGVSEEGIHRVSYEALAASGVDLRGVRSDWLSLSSQGRPVAVYVHGGRVFGPGSYLEFVGEPVESLYTRTNVYELSLNRRKAERVESLAHRGFGGVEPFYLETQKVERQRQYNFASPTDDPWYDERLLATSGPVETSVSFDLDGWQPGLAEVELEVFVLGVTNFPTAPDHHLVIELNGSEVADERFDGLFVPEIVASVGDELLVPVGNELKLRLPHDTGAKYDLINYDHLRVRYPRGFVARGDELSFGSSGTHFRVQGLDSPEVVAYGRSGERVVRLGTQVVSEPLAEGVSYAAAFSGLGEEGSEYWAAGMSGLRVPTIEKAKRNRSLTRTPADVLVISHGDFLDSLGEWVSRREGEGLSIRVVDVASVYRKYSHGVVDPEAIRAYVREAYEEMGIEYLLLVGGDTYDPFDYLGVGSVSFIPTPYAQTDSIVRYAPVDPLYGDVDGDLVPDLAVGRWPVRTVEELEAVIDKTLAYRADSLSAILAADRQDGPSGYSFADASEVMGSLLGSDWTLDRVYLDKMALSEARTELIGGMSGGPAVTSYFGHSSLTVWSFSGLFRSSDVELLGNYGQPTVVTQWGCWNTYHVLPTYETLGNRLLLEPDTGAAAVLGASTLTQATSERRLGRRVFERLAVPGVRLGQAVAEAKQDLATTDPHRLDVLLGWTMLGDPTLPVIP